MKNVKTFLKTRTTAAKENITVAKEVIKSDEFKGIRTKVVSSNAEQTEFSKPKTGISKLKEAKTETVKLFNAKKAERNNSYLI